MIQALHLLPLATTPPFSRQLLFLPKPHPAFNFFSTTSKPYNNFSRKSTAQRSSINGDKRRVSAFFDEDGDIDDMEGYLNRISLEYDSVWDTKPSWCQPWTILLGGMFVIAFSWIWLQSIVISSMVSCLISAWWYIFLYSYPKAYSNMITERRGNVNGGIEDTFGLRTDDIR